MYIGSALIKAEESLIGDYSIKEGTTIIASNSFKYCSNLSGITIPSSVKAIGLDLLLHCDNLTSIKIDPTNKNYDSRDNCNAIIITDTNTLIAGCKNTVIPESVTTIMPWAFAYINITDIAIPQGVTIIDDCTFFACTKLTNITIPSTVISIGADAFHYCEDLTDIYYSGTEEEWNAIKIDRNNETLTSATIHYNYVAPTEPPETEFLGDSNGDGKVNVKDATQIQKAVAGLLTLSEAETLLADVDSNGKVNVKDATAIQKWVAGIDTGFDIGK